MLAGIYAYYSGTLGSPLGDYSRYLASFDGLFGPGGQAERHRNRFDNGSIRVAGPLLPLAGGRLTATLLAEQRRERVAGATRFGYSPLLTPGIVQQRPRYAQATRSLYGELRAPLVGADAAPAWLRGLEVQLAVRRDWTTTDAAQDFLAIDGGTTRTVRNAGTVYTAGARVSPMPGILLRASVSTGEQPLTVADLSRRVLPGLTLDDPKRPGDIQFYDDISGGAPHPRPERARSLSGGVIVQPETLAGIRLSIDYTHIEKRGEGVVSIASNDAYFIANEARYPDRVVRAPPSAADATRGYTAGTILAVDESSLQNGRRLIDSIDGLTDYRFAAGRLGSVELHAAATWQPRYRRIVGFGVPDRDYAGVTDGAVALRGNAGGRLTRGPLSLSADMQLVGRYRITSPLLEFLRDIEARYAVVQQGGVDVPAQATLDLGAEYRVAQGLGGGGGGRPRTMTIRFGVQDVLDTRPAGVVNAFGRYNNYLDPRRRRFDLTILIGR